MIPHLQGILHNRPFDLLPSTMVRCTHCHEWQEITGASEVTFDGNEPPALDDVRDSIETAMEDAGWKRSTCPVCIETYPGCERDGDYDEDFHHD